MKTIALFAAAVFSVAGLSAAETLKIDPAKSQVTFVIANKPPGADAFEDVEGAFEKFSGTIVLDEADPAKSAVTMTVETASVDTGNAKRDDHLRNQDFFKVKEYPTMEFVSTSVTKDGEGNYAVKGDFTLLGEKKPMTVTFVPKGTSGGVAAFTFKRSDFGMDYRVPDTADEVAVKLTIATE